MTAEAAAYPKLLKIYKELKRHGFHTVHDFYRTYYSAKDAYAYYRDKADKWEENYGENIKKLKKESVHQQLQNYQRKTTESKLSRNIQKDYGEIL